jgi:hypothetical protein
MPSDNPPAAISIHREQEMIKQWVVVVVRLIFINFFHCIKYILFWAKCVQPAEQLRQANILGTFLSSVFSRRYFSPRRCVLGFQNFAWIPIKTKQFWNPLALRHIWAEKGEIFKSCPRLWKCLKATLQTCAPTQIIRSCRWGPSGGSIVRRPRSEDPKTFVKSTFFKTVFDKSRMFENQ